MAPEKLEHVWPLPGEHFFSAWQHQTGMPKPTQYRKCIHPECTHVEYRETPKA